MFAVMIVIGYFVVRKAMRQPGLAQQVAAAAGLLVNIEPLNPPDAPFALFAKGHHQRAQFTM